MIARFKSSVVVYNHGNKNQTRETNRENEERLERERKRKNEEVLKAYRIKR